MNEQKKNYLIYFYTYCVAQIILIYINVFLPVYFFNVLNVNRVELAFVQLLSYLALFAKPIIAIYFDKEQSSSKRELIIKISIIGVFLSFTLFIFCLRSLILFGIFFGINIACIAIMDVGIDKIIVDSSPDSKVRDKNALFTQLGSVFGAILPNFVFFFIFEDIYSLPTWNQFFFIGILSVFPIIFMIFFLKHNIQDITKFENLNDNEINIKNIIILGIILFLFYGERIYEYPLEPWILNKYGEENFSLFLIFLIILIIINALGLILGGSISNKFDRKKLLFISSLVYGVLLIVAPFNDMIIFFILFGIMQIFSGIIVINLISLMIHYSNKKVVNFQSITIFGILAFIVFIPLGTYLSAVIETELIIVIAGILKLLSLIPIYFLKDYKTES